MSKDKTKYERALSKARESEVFSDERLAEAEFEYGRAKAEMAKAVQGVASALVNLERAKTLKARTPGT